jgi:filamentous hemagglutinin family protein
MKARSIFRIILASCCLLTDHPPILAQIVPDETLGAESSRVMPQNSSTERIEGGARRGANLFHSFQQFNVNQGRGVYFVNPAGIENILSRVTGGNPSEILGTLGVLGNANLFFLNPNGIIFGLNARLDIQGSFLATTANRFTFPDGNEFSASNPQTPPLLTVSVPLGLQYGLQQPAPLVNAGNLEVGQGQNLTLVGGTVVNTGKLIASGGQIGVAAVPERSLVRIGTGQLLGWEQVPITGENPSGASTLSLAELVKGAGLENAGIPIGFHSGTVAVSGLLDVSNALGVGGNVQVLGDRVGLLDATINASGTRGGGTVLVGGDYKGQGIVPNASRTYVSQNSAIRADALQSGDGGRVIVWADEVAGFYGSISVRGASSFPSNGGFVEVSGKQNLIFQGTVDTSAPNGNFGTLLLDPLDITIVNGNGGANDNQLNAGIPGGDSQGQILSGHGLPGSFTISEQSLENLPADTNVLLEATRDIIINNLTDRELLFLEGSGSSITFKADADGDGVGSFVMMNRQNGIGNRGRNITISGASITAGWIRASPVIPGSRGGDITLIAKENILAQDVQSIIFWDGDGDGGNISLTAGGDINIDYADARNYGLSGNSGSISIRSSGGSINVSNYLGTRLRDINPDGIGGSVILEAANDITVPWRGIDTSGGDITVKSGGSVLISSLVSRTATGFGNGGAIGVTAKGDINITGVYRVLIDDVYYAINSSGDPSGGSISLTSTDGAINISGGSVDSSSNNGRSGAIALSAFGDITTGDLTSRGGTSGGDITLTSNGRISSTNSRIASDTYGAGKSGDINIQARSVAFTDGTQVTTSSRGEGQGGNLTVNAWESLEISGTSALGKRSFLSVEAQAAGGAGNLTIHTGRLIVRDGAAVSASINRGRTGRGGNLTVSATESVEISGTTPDGQFPSALAAGTGGSEAAGNLTIETKRLSISNGAVVATSTRGEGAGGNLTVNASELVELIGTSADGQFPSVLSTDTAGNASAGDLRINTGRLIVRDGAAASVSTIGQGSGGSLVVNASTSVELSDTSVGGFASGLYAQAFATGKAGDLTITTGDLIVRDRAQVTVAAGSAADARVPTGPLVFFLGNDGVIPRVDDTATGAAGNLRVDADAIVLNNQGKLLASTASGEGGNIQLEARDLLLMRHNSLISAEARGTGNGGNIDITNTQFIVAVPFEDSDIIANAFEGRGGNIEIETQGIFGLEKRRAIQGNGTSDIDASSEFGVSGTVTINTPDVDPSRGLATLPTNVADPSQQIAQSCAPRGERTSRFVATGRGGLPLSPDEPLRGRAVVRSGWVTLDEEAQTSANGLQAGNGEMDAANSSPTEIVEADGWVLDAKGNVVLVARSQITNPVRSNTLQSLCYLP